ncbi:hypothetical protein F0562_003444 [Nyssa sinensis]|uniref:Transposase Tnp1/En/Spm-like domain-containing protein n=1 Tax=Nyssa sinensis TaxID=561372 RepID=A0A5J5BVG0_9ASTE|nr:hypothetical protein F0562_003444 [Nyssa sinensis]
MISKSYFKVELVPEASSAHCAHQPTDLSQEHRLRPLSPLSQTSPSKRNVVQGPKQHVGMKVDLLSFQIPKEIVGKGYIKSFDPSKLVGGIPLGEGMCEVFVEESQKYRYRLVRLIGTEVLTIRDGLGESIAWPIYDVMYLKS